MKGFTLCRFLGLVGALLTATISPAVANDTAVLGAGGTWRMMRGEHRSLQMVREDVRIDIGEQGRYTVDAHFVFKNHGNATTVTMGFPESGGGPYGDPTIGNHTHFRGFTTTVDGRTIRVTRRLTRSSNEDYLAYWVKRVRFLPGQTRHVRVRYHADAGGSSMGDRYVSYDFTGGNWRGKVTESTLTVDLHPPGTYFVEVGGNGFQYRRGSRFYYRWRNWQAQREYRFSYLDTLPGYLNISTAPYYAKWQTVKIGTDRTPLEATWLPAAFQRNGIVFMDVRLCRRSIETPQRYPDRYGDRAIQWNHRTKAVTTRMGSHEFRLRAGEPWMVVDGKQRVRLPAPPVLARSTLYRRDAQLYVPLAPVLHVLGEPMTVNAREHRIRIGRSAPGGRT